MLYSLALAYYSLNERRNNYDKYSLSIFYSSDTTYRSFDLVLFYRERISSGKKEKEEIKKQPESFEMARAAFFI